MIASLMLAGCAAISPAVPTDTPAPAASPAPTPIPAAATVNGTIIPLAEFQAQVPQYIAAQAKLGNSVSEEGARTAVLDDMIAQVLLADGARTAGIALDDAGLQARVDALVQKLGGQDKLAAWQSANGYDDTTFPVALRRAADASLMTDKIAGDVPRTAEQVHVQQILMKTESGANGITRELGAGADFDTVASRIDPVTRGDLSWFPRGYIFEPLVEDAAFALKVGEFSGVIKTAVGYTIIKVLERDPARPLTSGALQALQEKAVQDWVANARASASIVMP